MAADLLSPDAVEASLPEYEPERYYAVWQHPERRYAYMIDYARKGWLIALDSEEAGKEYLLSDAIMNGRAPSRYRLDELTLPDAFAVARAQPVPFVSSQGISVQRVLGVMIRTVAPSGTITIRHIPL